MEISSIIWTFFTLSFSLFFFFFPLTVVGTSRNRKYADSFSIHKRALLISPIHEWMSKDIHIYVERPITFITWALPVISMICFVCFDSRCCLPCLLLLRCYQLVRENYTLRQVATGWGGEDGAIPMLLKFPRLGNITIFFPIMLQRNIKNTIHIYKLLDKQTNIICIPIKYIHKHIAQY